MGWGNKRGATSGTWVKPAELAEGTSFDVTFAKWFETDKGRAVCCVNNDDGSELLFGGQGIRGIFEDLLVGARVRLTYEETTTTKAGQPFHLWSYEPWIDDESDNPAPGLPSQQKQNAASDIDAIFASEDEIPF